MVAHAVLERYNPSNHSSVYFARICFVIVSFKLVLDIFRKSISVVYEFLFVSFVDFNSIFIPGHDTTVVYTFLSKCSAIVPRCV